MISFKTELKLNNKQKTVMAKQAGVARHVKERTFHCSHCGNSIDRDLNASINLCNAVETCAALSLPFKSVES